MPAVATVSFLSGQHINGAPPGRRCKCESVRSSEMRRRLAKRRVLPERAEGRSGAIGRPPLGVVSASRLVP